MKTTFERVLTATLLAAGVLGAQDGLRGHWSGNIEIPNNTLGVEVDIDKTASGSPARAARRRCSVERDRRWLN